MAATIVNRRAGFDYELMERLETGLVLTGLEVKGLRAGQAQLGAAFVLLRSGEAWLYNLHVVLPGPGPAAGGADRPRKLLLHRRELDRLAVAVSQAGLALVPLKLYEVRGRYKLEVAVARGKKNYDKRAALKTRQATREMARGAADNKRKEE